MDCLGARARLWPPERPKLLAEDVEEARRHADACSDCQDFLAQDRELLDAYMRMRGVVAPRDLRERVFDALSGARGGRGGEPAPTRRLRMGWVGMRAFAALALAGAGIAATVAVSLSSDHAAGAGGSKFVEDYLRRTVAQDQVATRDHGEVSRFLMRELGVALRPIALAGLELERAEICLFEGHRGAMIVYRMDGEEIVHYLVPNAEARPRDPELYEECCDAAGGAMPVVTWASDRVEQALVGGVATARLLTIAGSGAP